MATKNEVLDVLVQSATATELVAVKLRDGQQFRDGVCEVYSACGARYVIFHAHNRINVDDIADCASVPVGMEAVP